MRRDASFGKGSSTTSTQGVTSNIIGEMGAKTTDEPATGRHGAVLAQPQFGVKGKEPVTGMQILAERFIRVIIGCVTLKHNTIPFKKPVGFVAGQKEGETRRQELDCGPLRHLPIILEGPLVRPDQFTQAHERMEADQQKHEEKEVVVTGDDIYWARSSPSSARRSGRLRVVATARSFLQPRKVLVTRGWRRLRRALGIVVLKLVADPREVRVDRRRFDVVRHVDNIETECIRSGVDREVM
jgi:hypothetical protein